MSEPLLANDKAIKSTPCFNPKLTISSLSLSVTVGNFTSAPGKLQFFLSPILASLQTLTITLSFPTLLTSHTSDPSAINT